MNKAYEAFHHLDIGVILLNHSLEVLFINDSLKDSMDDKRTDSLGSPIVQMVPSFLGKGEEILQRVLKEKREERLPSAISLPLQEERRTGKMLVKRIKIDEESLLMIQVFPSRTTERFSHERSIVERDDKSMQHLSHQESDKRLKNLLDYFPGVIYLCHHDSQYSMFYINSSVESLTGYTREDFLNQQISFTQLYHPDDREKIFKEVEEALDNRSSFHLTYRIIDRENHCKWVEEFGGGVFSESGELLFLEGFLRDITKKKKMEKALKESDEHLRLIFQEVSDVAIIITDHGDRGGRILEFSVGAEAIFGYKREEILGEFLDILCHQEDRDLLSIVEKGHRERGESLSGEAFFQKKGGELFPGFFTSSPLNTSRMVESGHFFMIFDLTEQKRVEEGMKHLKERLELATKAAGIGIWDWDLEVDRLIWDDGMYQLYGINEEDFTSAYEAWLAGLHPEDRERSNKETIDSLEKERDFNTEFRVIRPDGTIRHLKAYGQVIRDDEGIPSRMIGVNYDITESILAQRALKDEERRYRTLFNNSPYGVLLVNPYTAEAIEYNDTVCKQLGYTREEFSRITVSDYEILETPKETRERIERIIKGSKEVFETRHRKKNGEILDVQVTAQIIHLDNQPIILAQFQDITEQKIAQRDLKEREEQLRSIFEAAENVSFVITDIQGIDSTIQEFSPGSEKIFGYNREEIIGKKVKILHKEEDYSTFSQVQREMIETREGISGETTLIRKSGEEFPALFTTYPLFDGEGGVKGILGVSVDLSERKRIEEAFEQSEKRYRGLVETQNDLIVRVDMENRLTYVNEAYCKTFGKTREELLGESFTPLVHEEDIESTLKSMERLYEPPFRVQLEQRAMTVSGWRWILWEDSAILDEKGEIIEIQGVGRDISYLKQTEKELRESEERYRSLVEQAVDGILITDDYLRFIEINQSGAEIVGYTKEELLQLHLKDLFYKEDPSQLKEAYERLSRGDSLKNEWKLERKDGTLVDVEVYSRMLNNGTILAIIRDITERKQAEESIQIYTAEMELKNMELEQARNQALEASRAKSDFLSTMSHEIRTPLNSIIGMAELLDETSLDKTQKEYVRIFRNAGDNLLNLINDILDLSKIEAGYIKLDREPFDLITTIEKTMDLLNIRAREKGLELLFFISPEVPPQLIGDPSRLRQILINLLGNAIKFTEEGEVFLSIDLNYIDDTEVTPSVVLIFSVRDTGIGIPPEKQETIFSSFTQVDSSRTRKYGGTGLGLSISKKLVEMMEGTIWVESMEDMGSIFSFTAHFGLHDEHRDSLQLDTINLDLSGVRILLVDDNSTNLMIIKEMLSGRGAYLKATSSGLEALEELEDATKRKRPYNLMLLDYLMPGIDGFEVARRIKEEINIDNLAIIMFSSDLRDGEKQKNKDLFIDEFLEKPIRRKELLHTVCQVMEKITSSLRGEHRHREAEEVHEKREESSEESKGEPKEEKGLNILLVEDSQDNRLLLKVYLKSTSHQLTMEENGEQALKNYMEHPNTYDLILMDIQMPVMDGYEATREIRAYEREKGLKRTPIVALTAHALKEDIKRALESGFDGHLSKPIKKQKLLDSLDDFS